MSASRVKSGASRSLRGGDDQRVKWIAIEPHLVGRVDLLRGHVVRLKRRDC